MTTVDDPMSLEEAMRIIRGVVEHNTKNIPNPAEIAEAMVTPLLLSFSVFEEMQKLSQAIERASALMAEASKVLQDAWDIVKDFER